MIIKTNVLWGRNAITIDIWTLGVSAVTSIKSQSFTYFRFLKRLFGLYIIAALVWEKNKTCMVVVYVVILRKGSTKRSDSIP